MNPVELLIYAAALDYLSKAEKRRKPGERWYTRGMKQDLRIAAAHVIIRGELLLPAPCDGLLGLLLREVAP